MPTLVFVHIGTMYPKYLINNIERTRRLYPEKKIVLIGDFPPNRNWLESTNVKFFIDRKNEAFEKVFSFGNYEAHFRDGYWRHTLERLLALEAYHEENSNESLLHIESDVIIFPDFPFETFAQVQKVSWMNHSPAADIASLVFLPNLESTKSFSNHLVRVFGDKGGSDMDVLYEMRKEPHEYGLLPTINTKLISYNNSKHPTESLIQLENDIIGDFTGVFDALGLGMWIAGIDPRNKYGFTRIHARNYIDTGVIAVDPSNIELEVTDEGKLLIRDGDELVPVYNLHIHSKDKKLLSVHWIKRLKSLIYDYNYEARTIDFSATILFHLVVQNIKNRTLIQFVSQMPGIRKIKESFSTIRAHR